MQEYLVTVFSHYDAVLLWRELRKRSVECELIPAPRTVSTSCGTSLRYFADSDVGQALFLGICEPEQLFRITEDGYERVLDNR